MKSFKSGAADDRRGPPQDGLARDLREEDRVYLSPDDDPVKLAAMMAGVDGQKLRLLVRKTSDQAQTEVDAGSDPDGGKIGSG